jgi:hypothetical protein
LRPLASEPYVRVVLPVMVPVMASDSEWILNLLFREFC